MQPSQPIIRVTDLIWIERCPRHLWLEAHGDPSTKVQRTRGATVLAAQGRQHEQAVLPVPDAVVVVRDWQDQVERTLADLRAGTQGIQQAALSVPLGDQTTLVGCVDRVVRVPGRSDLGDWFYEPIEVKWIAEPTPAHMLQLQCYRWMLEQIQGVLPDGQFWLGAMGHGSDRVAKEIRRITGPAAEQVAAAVERVLDITRQPVAPPIWFDDKACPYCPWNQACEHTARTTQDSALLPGLRRKTATALRQDNITTLTAIAELAPAHLATYPEVGKQGPKLQAQARAMCTGQPVRIGPATGLPPMDGACYLDLETTEQPARVWAFGMARGPADTQIVLVVPEIGTTPARPIRIAGISVILVPDMAAGWDQVAAVAGPGNGPVIHWSRYEQRFLRVTAPPPLQAALSSRLVDLQHWTTTNYALPMSRNATGTGGVSAKALSAWVGVQRPVDDSFAVAEQAFRHWCMDPADTTRLLPVVTYVAADVQFLVAIHAQLAAY